MKWTCSLNTVLTIASTRANAAVDKGRHDSCLSALRLTFNQHSGKQPHSPAHSQVTWPYTEHSTVRCVPPQHAKSCLACLRPFNLVGAAVLLLRARSSPCTQICASLCKCAATVPVRTLFAIESRCQRPILPAAVCVCRNDWCVHTGQSCCAGYDSTSGFACMLTTVACKWCLGPAQWRLSRLCLHGGSWAALVHTVSIVSCDARPPSKAAPSHVAQLHCSGQRQLLDTLLAVRLHTPAFTHTLALTPATCMLAIYACSHMHARQLSACLANPMQCAMCHLCRL